MYIIISAMCCFWNVIFIRDTNFQACTKTGNNRNGTTVTKPPEQPERPEQESEMTGNTETKMEHDRNKVVEHDRNDSYLGLIQTVHLN
jgi:hypothetical protein